MKKFIAILIIIFIAGSSGAGFFLYQKNKKAIRSYPPVYSSGETPASQLIPDNAVIVLLIKGLGEIWEGVRQSNFFLQMAEYQVSPVITSLSMPEGNLGTKEKLRFFLAEEVFLGAFGQDATLSFFPSGKEKFSLLVTAKTGPLFSFEEFLVKKYMQYFGKENFASHRIGNFEATTIPGALSGKPLHYALVNGLIVISDSLETLKLSLGIAEGGEIARLVDSSLYEKSVGKSKETTRFGMYVDNRKIETLCPVRKTAAQNVGDMETVVSASFTRISVDNGIKVLTEFLAEPEKIIAWSNSWVSSPPDVTKTPGFLPTEAMLYVGTQKMNLGEVVKYLNEKLMQEESLSQIPFFAGGGEEKGAFWEKEVLPLIGQEWCLALVGEGETEDLLPSLVMALEVKNVQLAVQAVEKFVSSGNSSLEKRSYGEFEIQCVKNGFLPPLEYFFSDNFLFFVTGDNGSNNVIDTIQQKKPSLEKNKFFTASGISLSSHFLLFFDTFKFFALAKSGIESAPQELLSGFIKSGPQPEEILTLAGVVSSLAMSAEFTLEKIKLKTYIALKDLPVVRKKGVAALKTKAKVALPPQNETAAEPEPTTTEKIVVQEPQKTEVVLPDEKEKEKIEATPTPIEAVPAPPSSEVSLPQPPPPLITEDAKVSPPPAEETAMQSPEKDNDIQAEAKEEPKDAEEGAKEGLSEEKKEPEAEFIYKATDYMGQNLRDPFASLIDIEVAKIVPTVDISNLWRELSKVEPINLYLYSHAQREDPKLIEKIENLTEYFKDSKKLEKKPEEEVNKKLADYSMTVAKLNAQYKARIISPLNFELDSLTLVGIIMGEKQNIALVQASDQKGYTLKAEDIVGTEYGKVVSITKDQVTIETNFRDYIGKISTKTKKLTLKKEEE